MNKSGLLNVSNKRVTVKVPATSANLGGGFDCMGLALGLYHTVTAELCDTFSIESRESGVPLDRTNLIYTAMNEVFRFAGKENVSVKLTSASDIPQASGLGSSAACLVAGVAAANALVGGPLGERGMIELCARLDGHPDNVLPAILGGVTAGYYDENGIVEYIRSDVPNVCCAVATPNYELHTETARAALPDTYSRADCVYSLSHAVVTFAALSAGNIDMLKAVGDKLHQPYRIPLITGYNKTESALKAAGAISVCVSGAGPSALAFFKAPPKNISLPDGWTLRILKPINKGVIIN